MKMIAPITITDATLVSSSVLEADAPVWDIATAYVANDPVISLVTHSQYICATGNTGIDPDNDSGTNWTRIGATNRWKAFDQLISDPVTNAAAISYTIQPAAAISGIAFFGLAADFITVTVTLGAQSYVFQKNLINVDEIDGWYGWLFSGVVREVEALFLDLPYLGAGTEYLIEVTGPGTVAIGQIILGSASNFGVTHWGAEIGILDFSRKDLDVYGNAIIVKRRNARLATFPIGVDARKARQIQRILEAYRATPAVWIGDDRLEYGLMIYGFYSSYSHVLDQENWSHVLIEVRGLV